VVSRLEPGRSYADTKGMSVSLRVFVFSLLLVGLLPAAPVPWAQVKVGMTGEEIITLLGDPLLRSKGRNFETWTYDEGAEVLVYGLVVGWTAPASARLLARSQDVWRNQPRGEYFPVLRAAVRQSVRKAPSVTPSTLARETPRNNAGMGYEEYLQTLGRTKG
jgi:hypothetical protein